MGSMVVILLMVMVMGSGMVMEARAQDAPSFLFLPLDHPRRAVLDQEGNYILLWTPQEKDIIFEVQVATRGYVGLGFSPNGGMKGADIVMGWVDDDGSVHIQDRYASGYSVPQVDASQDVKSLGGFQNDTHTVLRFSRNWTTCDPKQDLQLGADTVRVIWAYNNEDPTGEMEVKYHSQRGTKSLYLQEPQFVLPELTEDIQHWDLYAPNVSVPADLDTLYWCTMIKIPPLTGKTHMIGYLPLIEEKNIQHVHHLVVYECHLPDSEKHYEKWLGAAGLQCHGRNMPISWRYCTNPILAWAVGGEGEMFPEHVGFPLGEEHGGASYFMLEFHYDNPNGKSGIVDSSGLRIFYTQKLRQYDAGMMLIGHSSLPTKIIPPHQKWLTIGHCHSSCTQQLIPEEGVKVFQGMLHSHLLGSAMRLRHIRDGQELPQVLRDNSYDFNFQMTRILKPEVTILPGDSFITECDYDSASRSVPTFGGLGTEEEMCIAFLTYYPRNNFSMCVSKPTIGGITRALGIQSIYNEDKLLPFFDHVESEKPHVNETAENELAERAKNENFTEDMTDIDWTTAFFSNIIVKEPQRYRNTSLYSILKDDATWEDLQVIEALQKEGLTGKHVITCLTRDYSKVVDGVEDIASYPEFTALVPSMEECGVEQEDNQPQEQKNEVTKDLKKKPLFCPSFLPSCKRKLSPVEAPLPLRPFYY